MCYTAQKQLTLPAWALNGHCLDLSIPVRSFVYSALFSAFYLWCGWTRPSLGGTLPFLLFSPQRVTSRFCFWTSDEIVARVSRVILSHRRRWIGRTREVVFWGLWARLEHQSLLFPDYYPLCAYDKWEGFRFLFFQRSHMPCSTFSSVTMTLALDYADVKENMKSTFLQVHLHDSFHIQAELLNCVENNELNNYNLK